MNRAIIIPFHRYQPQAGEFYKVYFELLKRNLSYVGSEFDKLYIIDQEWGFSENDISHIRELKQDVTVLVSPVKSHHWGQFQWAIPQIPEEKLLFMDNDLVFLKKGIVDGWFSILESGNDLVSAFDDSGGLRKQVFAKYPYMESIGSRMASYYFLITQSLLKKIPFFNFEPITFFPGTYIPELEYTTIKDDWCDSFGYFTIRLLAQSPKISKIEDERASIYLEDDRIYEEYRMIHTGFYHIRNGNLPIYQLTSKYYGWDSDYHRSIKDTPKRESLRIMAWYQSIMGENEQIMGIIRDLNVNSDMWSEYMRRFKEYHGL